MRRRPGHLLLGGLAAVYGVAGVAFVATATPGGISLGLLFLGGVAVIHLGLGYQAELRRIRELLAAMAMAGQHPWEGGAYRYDGGHSAAQGHAAERHGRPEPYFPPMTSRHRDDRDHGDDSEGGDGR